MPHPLFYHPISDSKQPDDKDEHFNKHQWWQTETITGKHLQDVSFVPCAHVEGEGQTDVCVCVCVQLFSMLQIRGSLCVSNRRRRRRWCEDEGGASPPHSPETWSVSVWPAALHPGTSPWLLFGTAASRVSHGSQHRQVDCQDGSAGRIASPPSRTLASPPPERLQGRRAV